MEEGNPRPGLFVQLTHPRPTPFAPEAALRAVLGVAVEAALLALA